MKFEKLPYTIAEQVNKLKERGLVITNESNALAKLSNISYYRLRAYTFPFQDNFQLDQKFKIKINFDQIIELYVFDQKLRLLIFDAIEKIEIALRTQIIYHFSLSHGSHWQTKKTLYRDSERFAVHYDSLKKEINRSTESFISHYKNKYSEPIDPPCWMSLEVTSMGLLSKFFQNLKKGPEKNAIALHFGLTDLSVLENWILCFSSLRNICAHHGRIWNRRLIPIKVPRVTLHPFLKNRYVYTNKIYATLSCIEYVLNIINPENTISSQFVKLMEECPLAQAKEMGFPQNWHDEELWN